MWMQRQRRERGSTRIPVTNAKAMTRACSIRVGDEMPNRIPASTVRQLPTLERLTVWIRGETLQGDVIAVILSKCHSLQSLEIYRKDNDWDAQDTRLSWTEYDDKCLANALQSHCRESLESFTLTCFRQSSPIAAISQALANLPQLSAVKMSVYHAEREPPSSTAGRAAMLPCTFSSLALKALLDKANPPFRSLRLLGILPETPEYCQVLNDAYWRNKCQVHIFLQFAATRRPGPYPYYIRQVMELNQKGRTELGPGEHKLMELLHHVIRQGKNNPNHSGGGNKRHNIAGTPIAEEASESTSALLSFETDGLYHLLRENPWIFDRAAAPRTSKGSKSNHRMGRRLRKGLGWSNKKKPS